MEQKIQIPKSRCQPFA